MCLCVCPRAAVTSHKQVPERQKLIYSACRSLKLRCGQGHRPPEGIGEEPSRLLWPLAAASRAASLGLQLRSHPCLPFHVASVCVSVSTHHSLCQGPNSPLLIRTPGSGFRATLIQPDLIITGSHLQRPYFQIRARSQVQVDMNPGGHRAPAPAPEVLTPEQTSPGGQKPLTRQRGQQDSVHRTQYLHDVNLFFLSLDS